MDDDSGFDSDTEFGSSTQSEAVMVTRISTVPYHLCAGQSFPMVRPPWSRPLRSHCLSSGGLADPRPSDRLSTPRPLRWRADADGVLDVGLVLCDGMKCGMAAWDWPMTGVDELREHTTLWDALVPTRRLNKKDDRAINVTHGLHTHAHSLVSST